MRQIGLNKKQLDIVKKISDASANKNIGSVNNWTPSKNKKQRYISEVRVSIPDKYQNDDFYQIGTTPVL